MFQSNVFDYVNLLDKAADASWLRNEVIGNNISNATTPGYKRQDVAFESLLQEALHITVPDWEGKEAKWWVFQREEMIMASNIASTYRKLGCLEETGKVV